MKKEYKRMVKVAESLGWSVRLEENDFTFSKFSPAGQDFNIEVTADNVEDVVEEIKNRIE